MKYPKVRDYYPDLKCIYNYNGTAKTNFDTEIFKKYCNMIQELIYENNKMFEGLDHDTIYVIDVATNHCLLMDYDFNDSELKGLSE